MDGHRRRVNFQQLQIMWEFLNTNKELATGVNKTAHDRNHSRRMWESVAPNLNSVEDGAVKDWKGWSSYWVDFKAKLKRKVATADDSQGSGLQDYEKKFLGLLGDSFGQPNDSSASEQEVISEQQQSSPSACSDRPGPVRRRRHREHYMNQHEARSTLTELSKMKMEIYRENNRLLQDISYTLKRLTDVMIARYDRDPARS